MNRTSQLIGGVLISMAHVSPVVQAREPALSPTKILETAVHDAAAKTGGEALLGLRRLRDPALRPLFSSLATSSNAGRRRQGVLGLAELETPPRMNPLLLTRIADPFEQAALLAEGLALDLIGNEQIEQILAWPNLKPYVELLLRARLAREGKPLDTSRVEALAEKGEMSTELLASALLAQSGSPARLEAVAGRLLGMSDPQRGALVGTFLETIRRERLSAATPLLRRLDAAYSTYPSLNADILRIWIRLSASEGLAVWKQKWEKGGGLADQLRLALVALDASDIASPELYAPIEKATGEAALSAMGRLGATLARKEPATPALTDLIRLRYLPVELWIIERAKTWDEATASEAYRALITVWASRASTPDPVSDAVLPAAEGLVSADREFLASTLAKACERTDERISQAILMAHLTQGAAPVWDVKSPPRWPDKQSEALAVLVLARSADPKEFPSDQIPALEAIAAGSASRLPAAMRAQAAWLLIKIRGQAEPTLARLLTGQD